MREYEKELDAELNSVLNKYIEDEAKYEQLVVEVFEKTIEDDPEVDRLLQTFKDFGANDLEAKINLAELMLAGM